MTASIDEKKKIKIMCQNILHGGEVSLDIFYKIYPFIYDLNINQELKSFCSLIIDETDWIPQKDKRYNCSAKFLQQIQKEEENIINFYKDDIIKFLRQIVAII